MTILDDAQTLIHDHKPSNPGPVTDEAPGVPGAPLPGDAIRELPGKHRDSSKAIANSTTFRPMETWSQSLDLLKLAERHGSPLYIHHPATLWRNFQEYVGLVGTAGNVRYPVKANPSPLVLEALARWGSGADCASRPEVRAALAAGIPLPKVSYNTPAMDARLAVWLLRQGATVVVDSASGLAELSQILGAGQGVTGEIFLRINPGGLPGYRTASDLQRYTAHGDAKSQFGIPSEDVLELLAGTRLPISGLHVHVGTMMDNVETFRFGVGFLHDLVDVLRDAADHPVHTVNLGGGLGLPHFPDQEFPAIRTLSQALESDLRSDLSYHVEPGNSLVGDSFALLTRVLAVKEVRGRRWGLVDVGTDQLVKHTVARWEHQIVDTAHRPLPQEGPDGLCGPLCFAGDVLLPATDLSSVAQGDPLLVRHAGAYCEALSSRFNGRVAPACIVLEGDGSVRLGRDREDPFFSPAIQTQRPAAFSTPAATATASAPRPTGLAIPNDRVSCLQSEYMHHLAEDEGYELRTTHQVGERTYEFSVDTRAAVGFVAMPLALRILGDASITAVGLELGWQEKEAPVWATRLSLTAGANLPAGQTLPCRVQVSALAPGVRPGVAAAGHVHFELGANGEFRGSAKVSVPES